jgi:parvulin-like peptidyl-prolyl isomerase
MQKMRDKIYSTIDTIGEKDIEKYFNEHRGDFIMPDQVRASAIAVKTEEEANTLLNRIKGGAVFSQIVLKYSLDKQSSVIGGDLGFFTVARYTPIYQACNNLTEGQMGGPVEFNNNWWIFKVTGRINKAPKKLDQVRPDIGSLLGQQWRANAYNEWIAQMKEKTHYTMDLDLIKNNLTMGSLVQAGKETK